MSEKEAEKLAQLVHDICADKKMTRLELAEYLGVSERTLYRWVSGDAAFPQMVFIALELLMKEE
jgi:transcriptional regulator with XRE-family HTH domain